MAPSRSSSWHAHQVCREEGQSTALTKLAVLSPVKKGDYFQDKIPVLLAGANSPALCARKPLFTLDESWGKSPSDRCRVAFIDQVKYFDKIPPNIIKKSPVLNRCHQAEHGSVGTSIQRSVFCDFCCATNHCPL